ncbi:MAG: glycosyltransferase [Candidatus Cloacimonetes bacterium]|nr:glycosyltransferase [Candidatus Cloacimonadota bacterium]
MKKTVSVCIAARNESDNLRNLLMALVNQTYPKELYEVFIADDGSEDNSREIVRSFAEKYTNIHLLEINDRELVVSPKKNALTKAISHAKGEIILTTDADCVVPVTWIESMVSAFYDESVSLVAGYSRIHLQDWKHASILHKFEFYDFAALYSAVIGSYAWGHGFTCVGQNLAYTRKAFDEINGFESIKHLISGDDVNLMQTMKKRGFKTIFNFDKNSFVYTNRIMGWKQLINQRSRWAWNLKWQMKLRPIFFWIVFLVLSYFTSIIALIFTNWQWAALLAGFRVLLEIIYLSIGFRYLDVEPERIRFYPIWSVLMPILYLVTVPMGHFNMFVWYGKKPQKINKLARAK